MRETQAAAWGLVPKSVPIDQVVTVRDYFWCFADLLCPTLDQPCNFLLTFGFKGSVFEDHVMDLDHRSLGSKPRRREAIQKVSNL